MASSTTIKNFFAVVFFKFPSRRFKNEDESRVITGMWARILQNTSDHDLNKAIEKFMSCTKLYPDDDPFAIIYSYTKPVVLETFGDCIQLIEELPGKFGRNREKEAFEWLSRKSPLCAAVLTRFGYQNLCNSPAESLEFTRSSIGKLFEQEKARANETKQILPSALELSSGSFSRKRGVLEFSSSTEGSGIKNGQ